MLFFHIHFVITYNTIKVFKEDQTFFSNAIHCTSDKQFCDESTKFNHLKVVKFSTKEIGMFTYEDIPFKEIF